MLERHFECMKVLICIGLSLCMPSIILFLPPDRRVSAKVRAKRKAKEKKTKQNKTKTHSTRNAFLVTLMLD